MEKKDKEKSVKDTKTVENAENSNVDKDVKTTENATNSNAGSDAKTTENVANLNANNDVKTTEGKAGSNVDTDVKVDTSDSHVIQPVGYSVKLRDIHPQDSYGRCGHRFNKTDATYFSVDELNAEQVVTLAEDPWLELIPVCEE
ncbi:hypothetical protein [Pasteurella sp. PK-2025]|uniref:hypothetical protein n=1 Tax=unclassified Pasteurella TaxID=2621516 RepID=UPI003C780AFA